LTKSARKDRTRRRNFAGQGEEGVNLEEGISKKKRADPTLPWLKNKTSLHVIAKAVSRGLKKEIAGERRENDPPVLAWA